MVSHPLVQPQGQRQLPLGAVPHKQGQPQHRQQQPLAATLGLHPWQLVQPLR